MYLEMHHHKTYMYINFQQNRIINRSVITVHTNLFRKNYKFYKFATTNSNFLKKLTLSNMHHRKRTCISIFSKIGLIDQS